MYIELRKDGILYEASEDHAMCTLCPWQHTFNEKPSQRHYDVNDPVIFIPDRFQMLSEAGNNIIQSRSIPLNIAWHHLLADYTPPPFPIHAGSTCT